jgi:hypothetical protein
MNLHTIIMKCCSMPLLTLNISQRLQVIKSSLVIRCISSEQSSNISQIWRVSSSGIWRRVVHWVSTDALEEHIASILRVKKVSSASHLLSRWFLTELIFSTLKMKMICSSETSIDTQWTTRSYIPEDGTLHNHCCENLRSYVIWEHFTVKTPT